MLAKGIIGLLLALGVMTSNASTAWAAEPAGPPPPPGPPQQQQQPPQQQQDDTGLTPPRLSFADGQVSFWRPGAQDWVQAQINTPLAAGDQLYTGSPGNLELQIGERAFVRGWATTQIGLESDEPDFLQFKVTAGHASFDIRSLDPGHTVEVDTPNAAFTIEYPGYYRVDVVGDRTSFIARRSGRATAIPSSGAAVAVAPSEEVVIEGTDAPQVASYAAPKLDTWDRWNYARTDALLDNVSARYVPAGTYGVDDLDQYGTWRVVPDYGSVWVPTAVASGWVPYSTGSWVLDPRYGWTWVDTAPWGWAPFHYGRWVFVNGFWAWAPGPVLVRPVYAPALVAFFGGPSVGVSVGVGGPVVGWVALGWGEPCVPWWGRPGFIHRPWWGGWGGPRVVNNVVIERTTVVHVENIHTYRNVGVHSAVVAVHEDRFGHGPIRSARVSQVDVRGFQPMRDAPRAAVTPASVVPVTRQGIRPPETDVERRVVATRPPRHEGEFRPAERPGGPSGPRAPSPRIVSVPSRTEPTSIVPRAPFGPSNAERPAPERRPAPPRQGPESPRRAERSPEIGPRAPQPATPPSASTPQAAPAAPPAPQKGALQPAQPRTPAGQPSTSPAPAGRAPQPSARVEEPRRPTAPAQGQAAPAPRIEMKGGSVPAPAAPQAPARREAPARVEGPRVSPHALPGEPASRLAPNRGESRPPQAGQRGGRPEGRPGGAPEKGPEKGAPPQQQRGGGG